MASITMNGVTASLKFHEFDDFQDARWELIIRSGENYASTKGIIYDSKHTIKFNGEEAKLEFHKTDKVHWKLLFGVLEEGDLTETSEFDLFNKIAKDMEVKMAILCPERCFKDYMAFKPDIADRRQRISTYLADDWNKDSELGKQISHMKSVCKKYGIKFELELMRDFFECASNSLMRDFFECNDSMDSFIMSVVAKSDNDHRNFIVALIANCQTTTDKKEKAEICKSIYEYMLHKALKYVNKTPKFKEVVIRKAYELKLEGIPELTKIIDEFLTAIGVALYDPLYDPKRLIKECLHCKEIESDSESEDSEESDSEDSEESDIEDSEESDSDETDSEESDSDYSESEESDSDYVDICSQSIEDPYWGDKYYRKGGPCEKARSKLMQTIFKKEKLTFEPNVMDLYNDWQKTAPKMDVYKKMIAFVGANRHALMEPQEKEQRAKLMKQLFEKEKLEFNDKIMRLYYDWERMAPKVNRYKKMMLFINGYKNAQVIDDETMWCIEDEY